jgi:hypothetical protein
MRVLENFRRKPNDIEKESIAIWQWFQPGALIVEK